MKFFKIVIKVIILLIVLFYGSSYLFDHLGPGQAKELMPFMIRGMESKPGSEVPKGANPTPGTSGNQAGVQGQSSGKTPGQEDIEMPSDSTDPTDKNITLNQAQAKKILITRFSKSDLAALRNLAKDGLTEEEKVKALGIIRSRLTKEEFDLLYHKYYLPYFKNKLNN